MKENRLHMRSVVISCLVFFAGWTLRVTCVDLSGFGEYGSGQSDS